MIKIKSFAALPFFLFCLLLAAGPAFGQNPSNYYEEVPRVFFGGVVAGANFTQVDGDNYAGYHKAGLNAGGIIYAQIAPHAAFSLELLFSQKGSKSNGVQFSNSKTYVINSYDIKLNYIEIPLQFNYFDRRKSHFGGGLSISRLISSNETLNVDTKSGAAISQDTLNAYPFKKMDYSFVLGANLHIIKGLFFNARFNYSLVPIRKTFFPEFGRAEQYNNVWTVRLMYLF